MANFLLCLALFRLVLPIFMSVCILFRPSGLSAIYLLLLFYFPFVPTPTQRTMAGQTGIYLKILIVVSALASVAQLAFQIVLFSFPPYGRFLTESCGFWEKVLRHVGFVRLDGISARSAVTWLSPELLMLLISIVFLITMKKITVGRAVGVLEDGSIATAPSTLPSKKKPKQKYLSILTAVGRYATLAALCLAAVLRPSILGGLYFVIFLSAATWWACYKQLRKGFAIMLCCLMPIVALHICAVYAYQFQWIQELLDKNSPYARYFALTPILTVNCKGDPRDFIWAIDEWATYVNPIALYLLYYVVALETHGLLKPEIVKKEKAATGEKTPLIRGGVSPAKRYGSGKKGPGVYQDSTGSVTVTGENPEEIQLDQLEEEYSPSVFENILFALESILQVIIKSSYIATNIIMMAWSITYLSWITFVLLIWANLIWLVPNQRKSMLRSSPFLVFYAWFLLISAYIYSMNLTEDELPSSVQGVNLAQIGFVKVTVLPCNPLLVKCVFTIMFWVALRQYMQEKMEQRQSSALADMVAPLQVNVGIATGVNKDQEKGNRIMEKFGRVINKFLTKFWIWVVAITLFAVAITGQRMTVFRIIYMALFLFFVLSFQLSFRGWRRLMFGFWLTVIIYSMVILVLVYTYQFDNFPDYWSDYLHIPVEQQLDIGLERFETKRLFVRLVTPTFFVIITVIQLHYFHKDFMELSDPKNTSATTYDEHDQSSLQGGAAVARDADKDDLTATTTSIKFDLSELGNMSSVQFQHLAESWLARLHHAMNLTYTFLELHMPKIVLLFAMLLCVYDKCSMYFIVIELIILSLIFGRPMRNFAICCSSVLVSMLLLARMIYQIQYINPANWNVTCHVSESNGTAHVIENNAEWFGFVKSDDETNTLPTLLRWNIIYILVVTLWAVVLVRQFNYRVSRGKPTTRAFFMFPRITRVDADKSLTNCVKYLANYAFFKFGVEISLMATVALIGFRMDMYAVIYGVWLCVLYSMSRTMLSKIWNVYMMFIAIFLPLQYVMVVGLPPTLCIDYPWDESELLRRLQEWAYLLDPDYPPNPKKLICDFVLLLLVSRQSVVFRIEKRYAGQNYAGGSNDSIIHHAENKNFENPVPDFITYVRSYLDVFKRAILMAFLWVTLAIVFLAGTNRVNLFSIGYLIGAFVFLWQGSDIYLRPIPKILKAWNWLLGYNVAVILLKAVLQLLGCVFIQEIASSCWSIQLFGVGCVKKFGNVVKADGYDDPDECKVPREFIGMVWDGLCFGFLIMQRRIFQSYNFFHMIDETKATTILASRGAELIEELRLKRMNDQDELERKVLEKIKAKMDRIKATQQKIQGASYRDDMSHYADTVLKNRPNVRRRSPKSYKEAIRSGDYYMFDDMDDEEELDLLPVEPEEDEDDQGRRLTIGEVDEAQKSVTIAEKSEEEPQPGTSKDEDISELSEPREYTLGEKVINFILFAWAFVQSAMVSMTRFLNKYSKDYRYVLRVLSKEKKLLKEHTTYNEGLRIGSGQVWQPASSYHSLIRQNLGPASSKVSVLEDYEEGEMSSYDQPTIVRLLLAAWFVIMSRSELLCYFIIFLVQVKSATFLSLPLPLMVFLWGTLTIPRPSKTFWVTIIAYTEIMVLIKCMFQFDIIPWNRNQLIINDPFYPPRIIGIERKKNYALWDLLLLLVVFFHRFMLKSMGIWRTTVPVPAALLSEGDYKFEDGQLVPISSSSPKIQSDMEQLVDNEEEKKEEEDAMHSDSTEDRIVSLHTESVEPSEHFPHVIQLASSKYAESFRLFFQHLLDPTSRVAADVYSYMFLCDFFNFFVILVGYSSFGTQLGDEGVSSYLEDNRVPALFLVMLILQFMLIVIDRGIFLRKNILGKIIFQFTQIFLLHLWLFVLFPIMTGSQFNTVLPPQIFYMVKCFYLLLSAYQIRCGYPTRILGNFLCKGYNFVNMVLFKAFMAVPFLFELRTVMDWMWTDTSMTVFDWIKMEDIFAHIFQLKCSRQAEDEYPQPRGERKKPIAKYVMGGIILAVIIGIIWFPLVFFSLGNAVGEPNPPYEITLEIRIGPYEPVYKMSAQNNSIYSFNDDDMQRLTNAYSHRKSAAAFIQNYEPADIAAIKLSTDSANIWSISPSDRQRMVEEVQSSKPLNVRFEYKVSHKTSKPEDSGVIPDNIEIKIPASMPDRPNPVRNNLLLMLEGQPSQPLNLEYILPKFLKVTNRGTAKAISSLMDPEPVEMARTYRSIRMDLLRPNGTVSPNTISDREWWRVHENCSDKNYGMFLKSLPYADCNNIILYTFNDKIFPSTLNIITGGGIIGLYTTLVFVASRVLRGFFAEQCFKIMFEDMPNVDRVLQLCLDVYLVREAREYALEEDLFAKLVFLFRSPETLIKWTRPKEEIGDDEDPEGDD